MNPDDHLGSTTTTKSHSAASNDGARASASTAEPDGSCSRNGSRDRENSLSCARQGMWFPGTLGQDDVIDAILRCWHDHDHGCYGLKPGKTPHQNLFDARLSKELDKLLRVTPLSEQEAASGQPQIMKHLSRQASWLDTSKKVLLLGKMEYDYHVNIDRQLRDPALPLPPPYLEQHISRIEPRVIAVWMPLCMARLSSHRAKLPALAIANLTIRAHDSILQRVIKGAATTGTPTLVISYADLLWHGAATVRRIEEFVPCLGSLSAEQGPEAVEWFDGNRMKSHGSIAAFGRLHPRHIVCGQWDSNSESPHRQPGALADPDAEYLADHPAIWNTIKGLEARLRALSGRKS